MTHEQQLKEAIKLVLELTKGNDFVVDNSDVMDGNIYITLRKSLTVYDGKEHIETGDTVWGDDEWGFDIVELERGENDNDDIPWDTQTR